MNVINQTVATMLVLGILAYAVSACSLRDDTDIDIGGNNLSQTVEDLTREGFYAYVFPRDFVDQTGWKGNFLSFSPDAHCLSSEYPWNPVTLTYTNSASETIWIEISLHNNPFFFEREIIGEIPLVVEWIPTQSGAYYIDQSGITKLKTTDRFGMEIVVWSSLPLDELVPLISELEYAGPSVASVGNPWASACQ